MLHRSRIDARGGSDVYELLQADGGHDRQDGQVTSSSRFACSKSLTPRRKDDAADAAQSSGVRSCAVNHA